MYFIYNYNLVLLVLVTELWQSQKMLFYLHDRSCGHRTGDSRALHFLGDANLMCISLPLQLVSERAEV